jgi:hypothetical protein
MRLHIKGGYEPENVNLVAIVALMIVVAAAIFYLGESFTVPTQTAGFFGPAAAL